MTVYWCERAWLSPDHVEDAVTVTVEGTHIKSVNVGTTPRTDAIRLAGLTVPGFANCHSHAFHRALRGRTQRDRGTFWTWRDTMYGVASALDPDRYYDLALAAYREMAAAGITAVGEFHYLHHADGGGPYDDPNAMGSALVAAARAAGLRITLLDACYLSAGFGALPEGVQRRFSDGSADAWADRVRSLSSLDAEDPHVVVGAAIHSVRAVPARDLKTVAEAFPDRPLHIHLSEQQEENAACLATYGLTPTGLLAEHGLLEPRLSAVHATHLTSADIELLGDAGAYACFCPTTERDLADGVGPSTALASEGARLTLGSDSHAVIDMSEEMRALELDERLISHERGNWRPGGLLEVATATGQDSLGFPDAGRIEAGAWADLVTFDTASVRTAGTGASEETVVFAATAADITHVLASGRPVDLDRDAIGESLTIAIDAVTTA
jgi:formiminoglutamate deiminase